MLKLYNNQALQLSTCKDHALQESNVYRLTSLESTITEVIRLLIHDFARSHLHPFPHAQFVAILHFDCSKEYSVTKESRRLFRYILIACIILAGGFLLRALHTMSRFYRRWCDWRHGDRLEADWLERYIEDWAGGGDNSEASLR